MLLGYLIKPVIYEEIHSFKKKNQNIKLTPLGLKWEKGFLFTLISEVSVQNYFAMLTLQI